MLTSALETQPTLFHNGLHGHGFWRSCSGSARLSSVVSDPSHFLSTHPGLGYWTFLPWSLFFQKVSWLTYVHCIFEYLHWFCLVLPMPVSTNIFVPKRHNLCSELHLNPTSSLHQMFCHTRWVELTN